MDAPVITMPRSSDSQDFLEVDLGELKMTNRINWLFGTSPKDKKVILLIPIAIAPGDCISAICCSETVCFDFRHLHPYSSPSVDNPCVMYMEFAPVGGLEQCKVSILCAASRLSFWKKILWY